MVQVTLNGFNDTQAGKLPNGGAVASDSESRGQGLQKMYPSWWPPSAREVNAAAPAAGLWRSVSWESMATLPGRRAGRPPGPARLPSGQGPVQLL